jgi:succinate-semialdehyde dehydrogenase/glutarate-semialdehyde dehydrogenase/succinyl-CoA reductase
LKGSGSTITTINPATEEVLNTYEMDKAEKLSRLVCSGMVTVNNVVFSDPRVPFGGVKHSGFGRELSKFSMLEFVNIKSIRFYDELIHQHYVE